MRTLTRKISFLFKFFLISSLLVGTQQGFAGEKSATNQRSLRVLNWEEYLSPEFIAQWEQRTGAKLIQSYIDNDEQRDRIIADPHVDFDVVVVDGEASKTFGDRHLFAAVTEKQAENIRYIDDSWRNACGRDRAVPYLWGTLGILYRSDKLDFVPVSWADILKPRPELKGHIGWLEDYVDTLAPSLLLMNADVNTADKTLLQAAFGQMKELTPYLLTFDYVFTYEDDHPDNSELYMALGYSGDQYGLAAKIDDQVQQQGDGGDSESKDDEAEGPWRYVIPKEGSVLWVDCFAVMERSNNKDLAFDFLNQLNDPKLAAENAETVYVAPTNNAAMKFLSQDFKDDNTVFPDKKVFVKSQRYSKLSNENLILRNRITSSLIRMYETK